MSSDSESEISYTKEVLYHPFSLYGLFGAVGLASFVSIPFGLGIGALPLIAFASAEALALTFLPSSGRFQENVRLKHQRQRREMAQKHLFEDLNRLATSDAPEWQTYRRLLQHIDSLRRMANRRGTRISVYEVERLADAIVDYLGLWLARLVMEDRQKRFDETSIVRKIKETQKKLAETNTDSERTRLQKAEADFQRVLHTQKSLDARKMSVEAALVRMEETFDDLYQQVISNPNSREVNDQLESAVTRMQIEDDLEAALVFEDEISPNWRNSRSISKKVVNLNANANVK